jgi:hypothetical protein
MVVRFTTTCAIGAYHQYGVGSRPVLYMFVIGTSVYYRHISMLFREYYITFCHAD